MNDKRETKKTTEKENNMSISDKIIEVIEDTYGVDNITQDTTLEELGTSNDIHLVPLILLIEIRLGINIGSCDEEDDEKEEAISTVADIIAIFKDEVE